MKAYPKYKNSGIEWIGEIPDGWQIVKLMVKWVVLLQAELIKKQLKQNHL